MKSSRKYLFIVSALMAVSSSWARAQGAGLPTGKDDSIGLANASTIDATGGPCELLISAARVRVILPSLIPQGMELPITQSEETCWGNGTVAKSEDGRYRLYLSVHANAVSGLLAVPAGAFHISGRALDRLFVVPLVDQGAFCEVSDADVLVVDQAIPSDPSESSRTIPLCGDDGSTVDWLVAYTELAAQAAGGFEQLEANADTGRLLTNDAFVVSGMPPMLRIVGFMQVSHPEGGTITQLLGQLADDSDGIIDDIHTVRDALAADLVTLACGNSSGSSKAHIFGAFAVVRQENLAGAVLSHELGHNFGCRHSRALGEATNRIQYAHGYEFVAGGQNYHTIMSLTGHNGATFTYSDPGILFSGVPAGAEIDDPNAAYCALVIDRTRHFIANLRFSGFGDCDGNGLDDRTEILDHPELDGDQDGVLDVCQERSYVNSASPVSGTGASWADASRTVHHLLSYAEYPCTLSREIWMAAGSYDTVPLDRPFQFDFPQGARVYGGFDGSESDLEQRDPEANATYLTGDILGDDGVDFTNRSDNKWIGRTVAGASGSPLVLDGLRFTGSEALSAPALLAGHPTRLVRCEFVENQSSDIPTNRGGAIRAQSEVDIESCVFERNRCKSGGAAILVDHMNAVVSVANSEFRGNWSALSGGGAVRVDLGSLLIANAVFSGNHSAGDDLGSAVSVRGGSVFVHSSTMSDNSSASSGGAIYADAGNILLRNTVIWADAASPLLAGGGAVMDVDHCNIWGGWAGTGNIAIDPLFVDRGGAGADGWGTSDDDYGNLNVLAYSPVIDAGSNDLPPDMLDLDGDGDTVEPLPTDMLRSARRHDDSFVADTGSGESPVADIGAFERARSSCLGDWNNDGLKNSMDVMEFNSDWAAQTEECDLNGDGVINTADMLVFLNWWSVPCL